MPRLAKKSGVKLYGIVSPNIATKVATQMPRNTVLASAFVEFTPRRNHGMRRGIGDLNASPETRRDYKPRHRRMSGYVPSNPRESRIC